jgi:hypothetical protein
MDSDSQVSNWVEAAKLYISKCNLTPLPAQTFYVKLWDCEFLHTDTASLRFASVPPENDDHEVQNFLREIYRDSRRHEPSNWKNDPSVKRGFRHAKQYTNVLGGRQTIINWKNYELSGEKKVIGCLIQEVSSNPAKIADISRPLNVLAAYARATFGN